MAIIINVTPLPHQSRDYVKSRVSHSAADDPRFLLASVDRPIAITRSPRLRLIMGRSVLPGTAKARFIYDPLTYGKSQTEVDVSLEKSLPPLAAVHAAFAA